jgi:hypothetical protein
MLLVQCFNDLEMLSNQDPILGFQRRLDTRRAKDIAQPVNDRRGLGAARRKRGEQRAAARARAHPLAAAFISNGRVV